MPLLPTFFCVVSVKDDKTLVPLSIIMVTHLSQVPNSHPHCVKLIPIFLMEISTFRNLRSARTGYVMRARTSSSAKYCSAICAQFESGECGYECDFWS